MIGPGTDARILVATRPLDFRKGLDSLAALVKAEYGGNPSSCVVYVFAVKDTAAREGRNPKTGETMHIKASKRVFFSAAKGLKDRL